MDNIERSINAFATQLSCIKPGLVPHRPELWAKHTCCIENVILKCERGGGGAAFGYYFVNRLSKEHGQYLSATFHAIWIAEGRKLLDITPRHPSEFHWPIAPNEHSIIFALHMTAVPYRTANKRHYAPLPSKYFPVDDSPSLRSYLEELTAKEETHCQRVYAELEKLP